VGEATTAAEAVALAAAVTPDVVVLDLHLPDGLGTDAAARMEAARGGRTSAVAPAVVLCTGDDFAEVADVAGVYAVLPKSVPAALLGSTVRLLAARAPELAAARVTAAAAATGPGSRMGATRDGRLGGRASAARRAAASSAARAVERAVASPAPLRGSAAPCASPVTATRP
jgi:DNA-binding NarL/FixJ family response regulator